MTEIRLCNSCGRQMIDVSDFGGHNVSNEYCSRCTDESGKLEAFEEVLRNYIEYIIDTETDDMQEALAKARSVLPSQPAWRGEWIDVSDEMEGIGSEECRS